MLNRSRSERSFGIVVVCYGPPADLADRLSRLLDQTPHLVLVDNGPAEEQAQRGAEWGRVRALVNDRGASTDTAGPAMPIEVLGLNGTPMAGEDGKMYTPPNLTPHATTGHITKWTEDQFLTRFRA